MPLLLNAACEGVMDQAVLQRLVQLHGLELRAHPLRGKGNLDAKLPGMMNASRLTPWLALRDLDSDAECAPSLVARLAPAPPKGFRLQVAVRKLEAWLLADSAGMGALLGLNSRLIPRSPDELEDPRHELLALARRSRKGRVHRDFLPGETSARVGPRYTGRLIEFAAHDWNPDRAAQRSPSLRSLLRYLALLDGSTAAS